MEVGMRYLFATLIFFSHCLLNAQQYSLSFDGQNDYVAIENDGSFGGLSQLTLQAYIKIIRDGTTNAIIANHPGGDGSYYLTNDDWEGEFGQIRFNIGTSGGSGGGATKFLLESSDIGYWIHITAIYDGEKFMLYKNGEKKSSSNSTGTLLDGSTVYIGRQNTTYFDPFYGQIDEVRIWNRALSDEEVVLKMYPLSDPTSETGLVSYWDFNEGSGTVVNDLSGNNHHGNIHGALWSTDVPPTGPSNLNENDFDGNSGTIKTFALKQNYPNPFNPSTTIEYRIPSSEVVNLSVYNVNGVLVETLENKIKNAGSYKIRFNVRNLVSGVYFYRLKAVNFSDTKKFIIVK